MTAPYEFVCDDSDPMWLEHRRSMITGTVAPQLLGLNRFGSLLETYAEMRMGVSADDADEDARIRMDWGSDQQDAVVMNLQRRLGLAARRTGALLRSTRYPWLGATLDAWVVADERVPIQCPAGTQLPFEVKTTRSRHAAEEWEDDVPADVLEKEKVIYRAQMADSGKPDHIVQRIVDGKLAKFYEEACLLEQPFIKDGAIKVRELVQQKNVLLGENIVVRRFARYEVGGD